MMRMIPNFFSTASWNCLKGRVLGHSLADCEVYGHGEGQQKGHMVLFE